MTVTESLGPTAGTRDPIAMARIVRPTVARFRAHLGERPFWLVQVGVLAVTALHSGVEASGLLGDGAGVWGPAAHLLVVLYLLPVVYAGLVYGVEGGLLTGASIAVVASPNLWLWHRDGYEWFVELLFVAFVVAVGVIVAIPVEHERRERARADYARMRAAVATRQLRLVNDVMAMLVGGCGRPGTLEAILDRICWVLRFEAGAVATRGTDDGPWVVEAVHGLDETEVRAVLEARDRRGGGSVNEPTGLITVGRGDHVARFAVGQRDRGVLLVRTSRRLSSTEGHLVGAVASQIGVALENDRLSAARRHALRAYVHATTRAQEEERRRIARDLHDVATHELLLVGRDLEASSLDPSVVDAAQRAQERVGRVIEYLRRFSRDLRPTVLDPLGLAPAVEWLVSQIDPDRDAELRVTIDGDVRRLDNEIELSVYRIVEEAVRNALRHADARHIDVSLSFGPDRLVATVADDGRGYDHARDVIGLPGGHGLGLVGMRERADLVGGSLTVASRPQQGTRVTADVPLRQPAPAEGPSGPDERLP